MYNIERMSFDRDGERAEIDIAFSNGVLTIKGEKKQEKKEPAETHHRKNVYWGSLCSLTRSPVSL
jgi:hypothetical protein